MPPKGSGNIRNEDFWYSADEKQIQCKICSPAGDGKWLNSKSGAKHLGGREHAEALKQHEDAMRLQRRLEDERQSQTMNELRRTEVIAQQHLPGLRAEASSVHEEHQSEMWQQYGMEDVDFGFGVGYGDARAAQDRLRENLSEDAETFGLWDPDAMARTLGFGDSKELFTGSEDDEVLAEIMQMADIDDSSPEETLRGAGDFQIDRTSRWFPYPSKLIFLLDFLDNLPRLRISSALMRMILLVLKEAKCKDPVPSYDRFRNFQKSLRAQCGVPTIPCRSPQGNIFFMNDPRSIIAKDWSNPTTRKLIHYYPEILQDGSIREFYHAEKLLRDVDLDILSPMYDAGSSRHFYVNEVCRLRDGKFVVPIRWVLKDDKVHADAFAIELNTQESQGKATIIDSKTILICVEELEANYYDLEHEGKIPSWTESTIAAGHPARMPNPKRIIAGGDPLYCSFVDYFADDVSGNKSKSWNKHLNGYMVHRNVPREMLQQDFHIHFISTSQNASVAEQFREFKAKIEATHTEPIKVQDESGDTTRICIYVNSDPSDNPMASEICAHIGGQGNYPCRKCSVGGTKQEKASNEGYHALFEVGTLRTREGVLEQLDKQIKLACAGVSAPIKDLQTQTGIKDPYTQFWIEDLLKRFKKEAKENPSRPVSEIERELIQWTSENQDKILNPFFTTKGLDPTKDTPVEILHTILLGIVKYIWHVTHTGMSADQKKTYGPRLQSTNTDGLSIPAIRANYILQYAGSLIGRQLKILVQTSAFHVGDLVNDPFKFKAWKAAGELAALLWVPEIRNPREYQVDLEVAVANVLDVFAVIDPSKIIAKIKYHLLKHLPADARRFGPLVGCATENYESFNAIFRHCSILSNHLSPSRDIAMQLAKQEGFKHVLTGGWWFSSAGDFQRAGLGVRGFLVDHLVLQKLIGWSNKKAQKHGEVKLVPKKAGQKERESFELKGTSAANASNFAAYAPKSKWLKCIYVVSASLDECRVGTRVFAQPSTSQKCTDPSAENPADSTAVKPICGCISDILLGANKEILVVLELFNILPERDDRYGMPVMVPADAKDITYFIVPAKDIKFNFNAQHDCHNAKCDASGSRPRIQERTESGQTETYIVHKPLQRYIINLHSFHNAHLLREVLPRHLCAPVTLFENREEKHRELAAMVRDRTIERAAAREKRARDDGNDDCEAGQPPRKKRRTAAPRRRQRTVIISASSSMVANRSRRAIIKSAKARVMDEIDSEDSEGSTSGDSESASDQDSSDEEYVYIVDD